MTHPFISAAIFSGLALLGFSSCSDDAAASSGPQIHAFDLAADARPSIAFVTNGVDPFWTIAAAGARDGGKEFESDVDVQMPTGGVPDQKRIVEGLLARGVHGIAISPIDGVGEAGLITQAGTQTNIITQDSDSPNSQRICYVGMDNYYAGRMCGELVKEALPEGGTVMIFIGRLEQDNAKRRRQGVIDVLLGRPVNPESYDPPGKALKGEKYTILATRTDQFDLVRAKANAEDSIVSYPDLGCMVGLFAYNPPACIEALKSADKLGKIKLVAFDEDNVTLQGILDGHIHGTVVQNPYEYGRVSVRILTGLARGDRSVLPEGGFLDIAARQIRKDNCQSFWNDKKQKLGGK